MCIVKCNMSHVSTTDVLRETCPHCHFTPRACSVNCTLLCRCCVNSCHSLFGHRWRMVWCVFCCCASKSADHGSGTGGGETKVEAEAEKNKQKPPTTHRIKLMDKYFGRFFQRTAQKKYKWFEMDADQMVEHGYRCKQITGMGTFGIVYKACHKQKPSEILAVKRIELDDEADSREVETHQLTSHQNVVALKDHWSNPCHKGAAKKVYVYMVMEFVPKSLEDHIQNRWRHRTTIPLIMIKVFAFQMFKGLNYLHQIHVVHRDIKPCNLLVDINSGVLKICDFGCAKQMKRANCVNRTYVCSRYYRAPELVLKNTRNDESIDVWAAACVLAECFRGWPLFPGKSTLHQFGAIADVLGNPSASDIRFINPSISHMKLKKRDGSGTFEQHFPHGTPGMAIDLLSKIFVYRPKDRPSALSACADPYFDQLRTHWKIFKLPSGATLPPIFEFTPLELKNASADLVKRLLPKDHESPVPRTPSRGSDKQSGEESVSAETDALEEGSIAVFSELESIDVEEKEIWDCRRVRISDEEGGTSSMSESCSN